MCKVYIGYCGTSEIEHGLCACTVDNTLTKARGLSLRTGAQTMLYLSHDPRNALKHISARFWEIRYAQHPILSSNLVRFSEEPTFFSDLIKLTESPNNH